MEGVSFNEETYRLMLSSFHMTDSTVEKLVSGVYEIHVMHYDASMPRRRIGERRGRSSYYRWIACLGRGEGPSARDEDRLGNPNGLNTKF